VKGVHSLGSAGSAEKIELEVWDFYEDRTWVWDFYVWIVDIQWDVSPCVLIASNWGWPTIARK
jgi:hypothetical protein